MMKNKITYTLLLTLLLSLQHIGSYGQSKLSGVITNGNGKTLYLEKFGAGDPVKIDSVVINKKGKFLLTIPNTGTEFFRVSLKGTNEFFVIISQAKEEISLTADANSLNRSYKISGSPFSEDLCEFVTLVNNYVALRDSAQARMQKAQNSGNGNELREINLEMQKDYAIFIQQRDSFLITHPTSPAAIGVLNHINQNAEIKQMKMIEQALAASIPNSIYHQSLQNMVANLEAKLAEEDKRRKEEEEKRNRLAPGKQAPEIVMNDENGNALPLSSLKGKYVLIDFWASWCGPCRRENPNVVKSYHKYKDKGFTVYSVSIDTSKPNWLKAIKDDGLAWENHVSSLEGWRTPALQDYGVTGVPFTVLIDREGKIIGTNLRGSILESKLSEIFGF